MTREPRSARAMGKGVNLREYELFLSEEDQKEKKSLKRQMFHKSFLKC